MEENEELFLLLNKVSEGNADAFQSLVDFGYLEEKNNITDKAEKFMEMFIEENEELVYRAIMDSEDDIEAFLKIKSDGVLQHHSTFLILVRHLIAKGRILKKN